MFGVPAILRDQPANLTPQVLTFIYLYICNYRNKFSTQSAPAAPKSQSIKKQKNAYKNNKS